MSTVIIIFLLLVLIIFATKNSSQHFKGDGGCCGSSYSHNMKMPSKKLNKPIIGYKIIQISGMHCQHCALKVAESIDKIAGASAKVNLEKHIVVVSYDREILDQKLYDTIEKAGYHIISIKNQNNEPI